MVRILMGVNGKVDPSIEKTTNDKANRNGAEKQPTPKEQQQKKEKTTTTTTATTPKRTIVKTKTKSTLANRKNTEPNDTEKALGPYFVYLMVQLGSSCKNEVKVITAREIFADAYRHNSGEINDKGTKAAKGLWGPDMAVGAFPNWYEAEHFRELCLKDSRSIIPRRERFIELIKSGQFDAGIKCYDKRLVPLDLNTWLVERDMACLQLPEDRLCELYTEIVRTSTLGRVVMPLMS